MSYTIPGTTLTILNVKKMKSLKQHWPFQTGLNGVYHNNRDKI